MELTIDRLTKQFGPKIAVDRLSCTLAPGVYGLLGANGAGKTTLMRMVCDVLRPTSGEIRLDGTPVRALGERYRARLGYLPQDFGYYPDFSARDFMEYLAALKGLPRAEARRRSDELLELVGLAGEKRAKIRTFSGGMKQRLGIAQAVLNDPSILVLDEPTAGLDPKERVRFRNLIARLAQDKIVLLSTHIVSDVAYIADEILMMRAGALVLSGTPDEITGAVAGKVWEAQVDARAADALAAALTVGNVRYAEDGRAVVRFVADSLDEARAVAARAGGAPIAAAAGGQNGGAEDGDALFTPVTPTLEDLYLYIFRDEVAAGTAQAPAGGRRTRRGGHFRR